MAIDNWFVPDLKKKLLNCRFAESICLPVKVCFKTVDISFSVCSLAPESAIPAIAVLILTGEIIVLLESENKLSIHPTPG